MQKFLTLMFLLAGAPHAVTYAQITGKPGVVSAPAPEKWEPFKNIELWEYCLSLPLEGYVQNYKKSDVKAKHVFTHRTKNKGEMTVWGLDNTNTRTSPEAYFKRYYAGAEEKGLILEERKLDAAAKRFYGWGYWSNSYHESRFLEIVWLRDSEVIKFHATFPVTESSLWKTRLTELFKQTANCNY